MTTVAPPSRRLGYADAHPSTWRLPALLGAAHYEARPASSNSSTASWLFSATAIRAPRVCAAHRRVLALTAQGRRHTIRPATPLPRPPGRDRHARTRPGIRRMTRPPALVAEPLVAARPLASWNLSECEWTYSAPFVATPSGSPRSTRRKQLVGDTSRRRRWLWGDLERNDLATLSRNSSSPNRSKGNYARRKRRQFREPCGRRGSERPVVLQSLPPPIPPGLESLEPTAGLPWGYPQRPPPVKTTQGARRDWSAEEAAGGVSAREPAHD